MLLNFDKTLLLVSILISGVGGLAVARFFDGFAGMATSTLFGAASAGLFLALHAFLSVGVTRSATTKRLRLRLQSQRDREEELTEKLLEARQALMSTPDDQRVPRWMAFAIPGGMRGLDRLRVALTCAGYRSENAISGFVYVRILAPIFMAGFLGLLINLLVESIWLKAAAVLGAMVFGWHSIPVQLYQKARERGEKVGSEMADVVDILSIYVKAGVALDTALEDSAPKLQRIAPAAAEEFEILSADLLMTQDRGAAFDSFVGRADSFPVREFVAIIKQADRDGSPMSAALARLSTTLRRERVLAGKRKANKLPVKMLAPQLMLAMPAVMVTVLFTPVYTAARTLMRLFGGP